MTNIRSVNLSGSANKYFTLSNWKPTDGKVWTVAFWFKRITTGGIQRFTQIRNLDIYLDGNGHLVAGTQSYDATSVAAITDTTSWHHVCLACDTTKVTAADRFNLYLDGAEVAYAAGGKIPPQNNIVIDISSGADTFIGNDKTLSNEDYDGLLDEIYFIDTFQLTPSAFITGAPGSSKDFVGAFGPQGWLLNFDQINTVAAMGADSSGHAFNFTPFNIVQADSSGDIPQVTIRAIDLTVGSPVLGTPSLTAFALAAQNLVVGSPVLGTPELIVIGQNTLIAIDLTAHNPELGRPALFSFLEGALGSGWNVSSAARTGIGFIDSAGTWDAAALIDTAAPGPFEISQTIAKPDSQQVFRLTFDVAPGQTGLLVEIGLRDDGGETASAVFDPANGACLRRSSTLGFHLLGVEADPVRFGYYRFVVMAETSEATSLTAYLRLCDENLDAAYVGDGIGYVLIADPMLLAGTDNRDFRWEIGAPEMRFFWTVHLSSLGLRWFRCSQGHLGVETHLTIVAAPDLDCILKRWQPAQDQIVFDYSGMVIAGNGDPMAGTP